MAQGIDEDEALKVTAGVRRLDKYKHHFEIQTLTSFLNTDYETVLNSDDAFCTKVLLCNLEKITFENKLNSLRAAKAKKKRR